MIKYKQILEQILDDTLEYNSEDWGIAVNELLGIENLDDKFAIEILTSLSDSDKYSAIISTAFLIGNISPEFILRNRVKIKDIIKRNLLKRCIRANLDFIPVFALLLNEQDDYMLYYSLIKSSDESESSVAISNLLYISNDKLLLFNQISEFDFNLFIEARKVSKDIYALSTYGKPNFYKKLFITSLYKWERDKRYLFSITDGEYELFEYIYIYIYM